MKFKLFYLVSETVGCLSDFVTVDKGKTIKAVFPPLVLYSAKKDWNDVIRPLPNTVLTHFHNILKDGKTYTELTRNRTNNIYDLTQGLEGTSIKSIIHTQTNKQTTKLPFCSRTSKDQVVESLQWEIWQNNTDFIRQYQ